MQDCVTYNRVLLLDLNPYANCDFVCCVTFANSGLPEHELKNTKFTREFRLTARELPIYSTPRPYYVVAKVESHVDYTEEQRATSAVNDFIRELRKGGRRPDLIAEDVVENFKSRVQKRVPYVRKDERADKPPPKNTRRKRPAVSSSEQEDRAPLKALAVRTNPVAGASAASQSLIPPIVPKKPPRKRQVGGKQSQNTKSQATAVKPVATNMPSPFRMPATVPAVVAPTFDSPAAGVAASGAFSYDDIATRAGEATQPYGDDTQAIVLATAQNPIIMPQNVSALMNNTTLHGVQAESGERRLHRAGTAPAGRNNSEISLLAERVLAFDRKVAKNHARFTDCLKYLMKKSEGMERELHEIKQRVQIFSGHVISSGIASEARFPFTTTEDLEAYIAEDPSLTVAIARLVNCFFGHVRCVGHSFYRLTEVEYDPKAYAAGLINCILGEELTAMHYTWPSSHNQSSSKPKLPAPIHKAIKDVATYTLRGRDETWKKLEHKIMALFSSKRKAVSN